LRPPVNASNSNLKPASLKIATGLSIIFLPLSLIYYFAL
jgi:hypothetical protein